MGSATRRRPWRHSFALDQRWRWHRRGVPLWTRQRRVRETRGGMDRAPVSPHAPIQRHSAQTRRCAREAARGRRVSGGLRGPGAWSRPRNQPALPLRGQASTLGAPQVAALPASSQRSVGRRRRRTSPIATFAKRCGCPTSLHSLSSLCFFVLFRAGAV